VGLGLSTNPLKDGEDIPLLVRPKWSYYGKRFFIDNFEAGVTLWETPVGQLNLLALPTLEQLYFRRWQYSTLRYPTKTPGLDGQNQASEGLGTREVKPELHQRHTSALAGFEYNHSFNDVEFNLQILEEVSGYHDGREMRLAISRDLFQYWRISLGANYQNRAYINYFYGITSDETKGEFAEYTADGGGWSELVRLEYLRPISDNFAIKASTGLKFFAPQITASPLLDKKRVYSVFIGGVYSF
jgi:outer membrane protein